MQKSTPILIVALSLMINFICISSEYAGKKYENEIRPEQEHVSKTIPSSDSVDGDKLSSSNFIQNMILIGSKDGTTTNFQEKHNNMKSNNSGSGGYSNSVYRDYSNSVHRDLYSWSWTTSSGNSVSRSSSSESTSHHSHNSSRKSNSHHSKKGSSVSKKGSKKSNHHTTSWNSKKSSKKGSSKKSSSRDSASSNGIKSVFNSDNSRHDLLWLDAKEIIHIKKDEILKEKKKVDVKNKNDILSSSIVNKDNDNKGKKEHGQDENSDNRSEIKQDNASELAKDNNNNNKSSSSDDIDNDKEADKNPSSNTNKSKRSSSSVNVNKDNTHEKGNIDKTTSSATALSLAKGKNGIKEQLSFYDIEFEAATLSNDVKEEEIAKGTVGSELSTLKNIIEESSAEEELKTYLCPSGSSTSKRSKEYIVEYTYILEYNNNNSKSSITNYLKEEEQNAIENVMTNKLSKSLCQISSMSQISANPHDDYMASTPCQNDATAICRVYTGKISITIIESTQEKDAILLQNVRAIFENNPFSYSTLSDDDKSALLLHGIAGIDILNANEDEHNTEKTEDLTLPGNTQSSPTDSNTDHSDKQLEEIEDNNDIVSPATIKGKEKEEVNEEDNDGSVNSANAASNNSNASPNYNHTTNTQPEYSIATNINTTMSEGVSTAAPNTSTPYTKKCANSRGQSGGTFKLIKYQYKVELSSTTSQPNRTIDQVVSQIESYFVDIISNSLCQEEQLVIEVISTPHDSILQECNATAKDTEDIDCFIVDGGITIVISNLATWYDINPTFILSTIEEEDRFITTDKEREIDGLVHFELIQHDDTREDIKAGFLIGQIAKPDYNPDEDEATKQKKMSFGAKSMLVSFIISLAMIVLILLLFIQRRRSNRLLNRLDHLNQNRKIKDDMNDDSDILFLSNSNEEDDDNDIEECTCTSASRLHSIAEASDEEGSTTSLDFASSSYSERPNYYNKHSLGHVDTVVQNVFKCTSLNCSACRVRSRSRSRSPRVTFLPAYQFNGTAEI